MNTGVTRVAVWTDGMGSHQARCLECDWKGPWRERRAQGKTTEERAIDDAQDHGATHEETS